MDVCTYVCMYMYKYVYVGIGNGEYVLLSLLEFTKGNTKTLCYSRCSSASFNHNMNVCMDVHLCTFIYINIYMYI